MIECDLQDHGIDIAAVLDSRSWPWLRTRIEGLLTVPSRLSNAMP